MGFPGEDRYREMATRLGLTEHVTFTGPIDYEKTPLYLVWAISRSRRRFLKLKEMASS